MRPERTKIFIQDTEFCMQLISGYLFSMLLYLLTSTPTAAASKTTKATSTSCNI